MRGMACERRDVLEEWRVSGMTCLSRQQKKKPKNVKLILSLVQILYLGAAL
jgi:hypothetical protein